MTFAEALGYHPTLSPEELLQAQAGVADRPKLPSTSVQPDLKMACQYVMALAVAKSPSHQQTRSETVPSSALGLAVAGSRATRARLCRVSTAHRAARTLPVAGVWTSGPPSMLAYPCRLLDGRVVLASDPESLSATSRLDDQVDPKTAVLDGHEAVLRNCPNCRFVASNQARSLLMRRVTNG